MRRKVFFTGVKEASMALGNHIPGMQRKSPVMFDVLGMAVTEINHIAALRSRMEMTAGLIVMAVRWGGAAELAGVETGDIISKMDGKATTTLKDLEDLMAAHEPQEPFWLLFRRVGTWRFLSIPFDEIASGGREELLGC
jgi:S1-C subfamily serine protease